MKLWVSSILALVMMVWTSPAAWAGGHETETVPTVLVTGANRGIGFEFTKQYAERGWNVIATARKPSKADDLKALAKQYPRISIETLDVTKHKQIDRLAKKYEGQPIDILINNAGIGGGGQNQFFGKLKYDVFEDVMEVNALGPIKMAEAFLPHIEAGTQKKIMTVSSSQGSITQVNVGMLYFYRASKSALNMMMRNLSFGLKGRGITVGMVAPGATDTDFMKGVKIPLGKPSERVAGMITVIDNMSIETTGSFIEWTGDELPW